LNRLEPGLVLGNRYQLERRIASGGMADVWAAADGVLQRQVAVKVMRPDPDHEDLFALRFRDEALHSAALNHTNIATLFDYGEDDGLAFLVMELVDGKPLSQVIRERGRLTVSPALPTPRGTRAPASCSERRATSARSRPWVDRRPEPRTCTRSASSLTRCCVVRSRSKSPLRSPRR
jgi:hypothetical protein